MASDVEGNNGGVYTNLAVLLKTGKVVFFTIRHDLYENDEFDEPVKSQLPRWALAMLQRAFVVFCFGSGEARGYDIQGVNARDAQAFIPGQSKAVHRNVNFPDGIVENTCGLYNAWNKGVAEPMGWRAKHKNKDPMHRHVCRQETWLNLIHPGRVPAHIKNWLHRYMTADPLITLQLGIAQLARNDPVTMRIMPHGHALEFECLQPFHTQRNLDLLQRTSIYLSAVDGLPSAASR